MSEEIISPHGKARSAPEHEICREGIFASCPLLLVFKWNLAKKHYLLQDWKVHVFKLSNIIKYMNKIVRDRIKFPAGRKAIHRQLERTAL